MTTAAPPWDDTTAAPASVDGEERRDGPSNEGSGGAVMTRWTRKPSRLPSNEVVLLHAKRGEALLGGESKGFFHLKVPKKRNFQCHSCGTTETTGTPSKDERLPSRLTASLQNAGKAPMEKILCTSPEPWSVCSSNSLLRCNRFARCAFRGRSQSFLLRPDRCGLRWSKQQRRLAKRKAAAAASLAPPGSKMAINYLLNTEARAPDLT